MWRQSLSIGAVLSCAALALAKPIDNPWPSFREPTPGPARSIGDYSAGCVSGAEPLPLDGLGFQVMRPSRLRYYGHPDLLEYIRATSRRVHEQGFGVLLIGDLSQPRGGRASGGHASHQTGLDVDVWFWHPKRARKALLPAKARESLAAQSILDAQTGTIRAAWKQHVSGVLRIAVEHPRVERIFVNPAIKRELCESGGDDRSWLRKLRPWHGHDDHFHARLACAKDDAHCKSQAPLPRGDGCDQLAWWFDAQAQADRKAAQAQYQQSVDVGRAWPAQCDALLEEDHVGAGETAVGSVR